MSTRNIYISYLRVMATIAVVAIHASTGFLNLFNAYSFDWNYANWINSFLRCSVPIFVAISGILLLHKEENTLTFYKKRIGKILPPFIFWTIVYIFYLLIRVRNIDQLSWDTIFNTILQKVLTGANAHLWYLYMIIGLYLAIPFIRKFVVNARIKDIEYFLAIWFLASFLKFPLIKEYTPNIDLSFFTGYLGYLVLGYYISIKDINWPKSLWIYLYLISATITALMTFYLSSQHQKYDPTFYNYLTPNTIICTAAIIFFSKKLWSEKIKTPKWVELIDRYSFGIYLIHIIPLNYLHPICSTYLHSSLVVPCVTILTVVCSANLIYLLRLIPGGKYISG